MNILMLGDVADPRAVAHLKTHLWQEREKRKIDFVVVNAENAAFIGGADSHLAEILFEAGADVLTGGNHTMQAHGIQAYLEKEGRMLRPLNFPAAVPGGGYTIADAMGYRMLVISAMGVVHMEPTLDNPFTAIDRVLDREEGKYDFAVLDFHAEATGEKYAMAHYVDGRIHVVAGTHTHVQTNDAQILPKGSGYVTDLGMCGATGGILGIRTDVVTYRASMHLPMRYEVAEGPIVAEGAVFTLDTDARRVVKVETIRF